ncbi:MAG: 1-(5-phosphoribosyl)-5-[(5-phosphoribosylamino)methylideneamino] imidazole-4-carboxamide isomerase [Caldilineales bacterium]|nr:1-(5-phosphoribosyl)-5-[(5-phosphoribosylamino)methylideneamino] imidazole-4-carboxamide isomerase [Caldilineales bacterium]
MIIFPAIDLRHGRCVRLQQGDPNAETVYGDDPAAMARHWASHGAEWLHVVNLDGAFADDDRSARVLADSLSPELLASLPVNWRRLHEICRAVSIPVQFGGGMRRLDDVELALALGAQRVILGTVAVRNPRIVSQALERFGPERIVVGIDARDGWVATQGWTQTSGLNAVDLAQAMATAGVRRIVYTDIARDGMLTGVNVTATVALAEASGLAVIASGGVASLADIEALAAVSDHGIEGVIVGQALYAGRLDLRAALAVAAGG